MSFSKSAESLKSRMHLSHIPTPVLVGAAALMAFGVAGIVFGIVSVADATPAFVVESSAAEQEDADDEASSDEGGEAEDEEAVLVAVHVAGAVVSPGVYELAEGSRVQDAVEAAGGVTEDAAPDAINLARQVTDGEQIVIPTQEEAEAAASTTTSTASSTSSTSDSGLVNINTADADELETLSGIGEVLAQAIIDDREANGAFESIEDIQRVSGIGEKKYATIKDSICV